MEITTEIKQIISEVKRYFNVKIIGSYILVETGLLEAEDINDIDIMVPGTFEEQLYKYLNDKGFKQTFKKGNQIGYENGRTIFQEIPQGDFKKDGFKIDVIVSTTGVYTIPELLGKKMHRGLESDYKQILKIISNKLGINIQELQHFKDSSVGLYCTDKTPETATKDDFFQLK